MLAFPQARVTDMHACFTPAPPPATPVPVPVPLPVIPPCFITVHVGGKPAARAFDMVNMAFPHPIAKGSMTVHIGNQPAARIMDLCGCGGMIIMGQLNVLVGG